MPFEGVADSILTPRRCNVLRASSTSPPKAAAIFIVCALTVVPHPVLVHCKQALDAQLPGFSHIREFADTTVAKLRMDSAKVNPQQGFACWRFPAAVQMVRLERVFSTGGLLRTSDPNSRSYQVQARVHSWLLLPFSALSMMTL